MSKRKRVLFIQYTNPAAYPPLEHVSRVLAKNGWSVLFLGTSSFGSDELLFSPHSSIEIRQMRLCPPGWRQKFHYIRFMLWAIFWTIRWRPHWIYASDLLSCPPGLIISLIPGVRVIYHEHDTPLPTNTLFQSLAQFARRKLAHRAVINVFPNARRADAFAASTRNGTNIMCVWNCPSRDEVAPARMANDGREIWALYHGSIVPARLPLTVIEALTLVPERVKLHVVGYETVGHLGYVDELRRLAELLGVAHRVHFSGPMSRSHLMKMVATCDVGLSLMPNETEDLNHKWMVGASNKAFDYLSCGLALVVSDLPEWRDAYVATGYGKACDPDDPKSIAQSFLWFASNLEEMRAMGERGRVRIQTDWNYESQFAPVLARLKNPANERIVASKL